jgi:hypothetical protein
MRLRPVEEVLLSALQDLRHETGSIEESSPLAGQSRLRSLWHRILFGPSSQRLPQSPVGTRGQPDQARLSVEDQVAQSNNARKEEAEEEYRKAIRMKPRSADAHVRLGNLLSKLGQEDEAENEYRQAIRIDPDHMHARTGLGNLLCSLGRKHEAEKEYREAIRIKPEYAYAHLRLGDLLSGEDGWLDSSNTTGVAGVGAASVYREADLHSVDTEGCIVGEGDRRATENMNTLLSRLNSLGLADDPFVGSICSQAIDLKCDYQGGATVDEFIQRNRLLEPLNLSLAAPLVDESRDDLDADRVEMWALYPTGALRSVPADVSVSGNELYARINNKMIFMDPDDTENSLGPIPAFRGKVTLFAVCY